MATKKAGGSTKNGRDSRAKRLGVKLFGGQKAAAGSIIVRQKGNKYWAGENVSTGKDFTLYALVEGKVVFTEKKQRKFDGRTFKNRFVHIEPVAQAKPSKAAPKKAAQKVEAEATA